jgi:hypothetical protein
MQPLQYSPTCHTEALRIALASDIGAAVVAFYFA